MAFTTYAELETAISNWLARDDLTAYIPDFIRVFESAACRRLKVRLSETTTTLTPTSGVATIPSDYLGHRRLTWTGQPTYELRYVTPPVFAGYVDTGAGLPTVYTIEGSNLRVAPSNDTALTFTYNQRLTAAATTLNWLFTNHPDAYLFGSLCEANAFDKAVDAAGLWKARRDEVFDEIAKLDFNERSDMTMRIIGVTP